MRRFGLLSTAALVACLALPVLARADTISLGQDHGGAGIDFGGAGPGSQYPSTIVAPTGRVIDIDVAVLEQHANPSNLDVALVNSAGTAVHLFSDACNLDSENQLLRFDDDAAFSLPELGNCDQSLIYQPTNHAENPDPYPAPGPVGTLGSLTQFEGGPSGPTWNLFTVDDQQTGDGEIHNWTMELEYDPNPGSTAPNPERVSCAGRPSTQLGTDGPNEMTGTRGPDVISGLGGNDTISGVNGKDVICGGAGKDTLRGGKGKDRLLGQAGKDKLRGGKGKDVLKGGGGKDSERQ
jgi:hypothetical protein